MRNKLNSYARKIVNIEFNDGEWEQSTIGVPLFTEKGFIVLTGLNTNIFTGYNKYHRTEESAMSDLIDYEKIIQIFDKTNSGQTVSSWLQRAWPERYRNIEDFLTRKTAIFTLDPVQVSVDLSYYPHKCPLCGEPAYIGIATVDCSKCPGV